MSEREARELRATKAAAQRLCGSDFSRLLAHVKGLLTERLAGLHPKDTEEFIALAGQLRGIDAFQCEVTRLAQENDHEKRMAAQASTVP